MANKITLNTGCRLHAKAFVAVKVNGQYGQTLDFACLEVSAVVALLCVIVIIIGDYEMHLSA